MRGAIAWSIQLTSSSLQKAAPLLSRLPAATKVYIPADQPAAIAEALGVLASENHRLVPVPTIAATSQESLASLEQTLTAWQRTSSDVVREVLLVGGDAQGSGGRAGAAELFGEAGGSSAFRSSLDILETGVLQRCGIEAVGFRGLPEGAVGISADAAKALLKQELQAADASGVRASVVTQFCFDAALCTGYVDALRADGHDVPVSLGIVGPDVTQEMRRNVAEQHGVAPPENSFFVTTYLRRIAKWQSQRGEAGAQALHLHPVGGLQSCLAKVRDFTSDDSVYYAGRRPGEARPAEIPFANFELMPPVPEAFASGERPAP